MAVSDTRDLATLGPVIPVIVIEELVPFHPLGLQADA